MLGSYLSHVVEEMKMEMNPSDSEHVLRVGIRSRRCSRLSSQHGSASGEGSASAPSPHQNPPSTLSYSTVDTPLRSCKSNARRSKPTHATAGFALVEAVLQLAHLFRSQSVSGRQTFAMLLPSSQLFAL